MRQERVVPGFRTHGWGAIKTIVIHDWISDSSSYEPMIPYLDPSQGQWVFMDLRGYGLSRGFPGMFQIDEAADDVLALADHLGWGVFHLAGHSMSGMVVQKVLAKAKLRVNGLVGITPVAASGQPLTADQKAGLKGMAHERTKGAMLRSMWGDRLSDAWFEFKMRRWRETADADASAGYVDLFAGAGFEDEVRGFDTKVLVIAGAHDSGPFAAPPLREAFAPLYPNLEFQIIASAGHYPMQETPALLASLLERFVQRCALEMLAAGGLCGAR